MTRFERIAKAFPLHAQRIAELTFEQGGVTYFEWWHEDSEQISIKRVLRGSFVWDITTEGHNYWAALANGARE